MIGINSTLKTMEEIRISKISDVLSPLEIATLEANKVAFKGNRCVANARLVFRLLGYECIEGFILAVLDNSREMRYCRHCWNMTADGKYFDVTAEYCFPKQPDEIRYTAMASCNEADYEKLEGEEPARVFCSKAVSCVAELNFDIDMDELKKLEKAVFNRGKELGDVTDELLEELNPLDLDKKLLELQDKDKECKDAFTRYKNKLRETIDSLTKDLSPEEQQMFQGMSNDIIEDTTTDTSRSRLQKLEDLKNAVLPYLR